MLKTSQLLSALLLAICGHSAIAAELMQITKENYDRIVPKGKEVDAIYGDWILRNRFLTAVIANPTPGRKANMTVRGVGGMVIDYTRRNHNSDQLSCFYPGAGRYLFESEKDFVLEVKDGVSTEVSKLKTLSTRSISVSLIGRPVSKDGSIAKITYTLNDDSDHLAYTVELTNNSDKPLSLAREDSLRCDGNLFKTGIAESGELFFAEDAYFGQCYGLRIPREKLQKSSGRNIVVKQTEKAAAEVAPGETISWNGTFACSQGLPGIKSWSRELSGAGNRQSLLLRMTSPFGPVAHAEATITREGEELGQLISDEDGFIRSELLPGTYKATITAHGNEPRDHEFVISDSPRSDSISFKTPSRVRAKITDSNGKPIAAKVQFIGLNGTSSPNFGPDSAISAVKNVVYCAKGTFEQPIAPGHYQVIVSHGNEYDAVMKEIDVNPNRITQLSEQLLRSVDTTGWVSTDFHSHSSPSGDNVSHQTGRVLNLLAENIEFAPCTEHNRVDTYSDDLTLLGAEADMATCTGIELTGSPLPINHQNAFPIHHHEHEQDGGGPQTDSNPVKQIERLALWDNTSSKVVQSNHPNIPSILGDRNLDNKPDGGFRGMLGWMDVIEIHPPQSIFETPDANISAKDKFDNRMFFWMQLLNLGYRIPGVVNTDAHYNFHGSGWLRNYLKSGTDKPADISLTEMIHSSEHGHLTMTTAPFLEVEIRHPDGKTYIPGDDVQIDDRGGKIWVRVQCPNWCDINRVQVFSNGQPLEDLNFTRKTHPKLFSNSNVRFQYEAEFPQPKVDTHIIVATIGEGLELGPVMGPERGSMPPVAVSNPIFIDVNGQGFQPNGDDLGVPFSLPPIEEVLK